MVGDEEEERWGGGGVSQQRRGSHVTSHVILGENRSEIWRGHSGSLILQRFSSTSVSGETCRRYLSRLLLFSLPLFLSPSPRVHLLVSSSSSSSSSTPPDTTTMVKLSLISPKGNQGVRYFPHRGYLGLTPLRFDGRAYSSLLFASPSSHSLSSSRPHPDRARR